jgi:hypothetical protein
MTSAIEAEGRYYTDIDVIGVAMKGDMDTMR